MLFGVKAEASCKLHVNTAELAKFKSTTFEELDTIVSLIPTFTKLAELKFKSEVILIFATVTFASAIFPVSIAFSAILAVVTFASNLCI